MSKLTNLQRKTIIAACLDATFAARKKDLEFRRTMLADMLYEKVYGEAERTARTMPRNWFQWVEALRITCDGFSYWPDKKDKPHAVFKLSAERPAPHVFGEELHIKRAHPLYTAAQRIVTTHAELYADTEKLRAHLNTLLLSVNTLARLREIWPEGAPYFPKEEPKVQLPVPANLTKAVNKLMGL